MQPISSGSTTERIVRTSLVTVLALGAAGWCFYDAYVGWPMENLERAAKELNPQPDVSPDLIRPEIGAAAVTMLEVRTLFTDVVTRMGEPGWRGKNAKGEDEARWFGPAGQLVVTLKAGEVVDQARYEPATFKSESELTWQVGMGSAVAAIAVLLLLHWLRVMLARTTLTDEGLKLTGRARVPFASMTRLRDETYAKKGWLEIDYPTDGKQGTLRLDDYKIKAFPEIIAEICKRKGWEDPYQKWQEQKKAREASPGRERADARPTNPD